MRRCGRRRCSTGRHARLFRNEAREFTEVDACAIPEALDERYASGFGDLSIHEVDTDPTAQLAYSSYYSGGFLVFSFGRQGLRETGRFIDKDGNNFWGSSSSPRPMSA